VGATQQSEHGTQGRHPPNWNAERQHPAAPTPNAASVQEGGRGGMTSQGEAGSRVACSSAAAENNRYLQVTPAERNPGTAENNCRHLFQQIYPPPNRRGRNSPGRNKRQVALERYLHFHLPENVPPGTQAEQRYLLVHPRFARWRGSARMFTAEQRAFRRRARASGTCSGASARGNAKRQRAFRAAARGAAQRVPRRTFATRARVARVQLARRSRRRSARQRVEVRNLPTHPPVPTQAA